MLRPQTRARSEAAMNQRETEAIVAICLLAAMADGERNAAERAHLRRVFDELQEGAFPEVYTRVLTRKTSLEQEVAALGSAEIRRLAFEMAVCVCDADGTTSDPERSFLERLRELA